MLRRRAAPALAAAALAAAASVAAAADCTVVGNCREVAREQLARPGQFVPVETQNLPWDSAFLKQRLQQSVDEEVSTLLTIAEIFRLTDHTDEARRLEGFVGRRTIKRLLGEPFVFRGTVADALAAEAAPEEPLDALRGRALRTLVADLEPGSLQTSSDRGYTKLTARVIARSKIGDIVQGFTLRFEVEEGNARHWVTLGCKPEERLASGRPARGLCTGSDRDPLMAAAAARLSADPARIAWEVASMQLTRDQVLITPFGTSYHGRVSPHQDGARALLLAADCRALGRCEQREALAAERRRIAWVRNWLPAVYLAIVSLTSVLLWVAARRWRYAEGTGAPMTALSIVVLAASLVQVAFGFWLAQPHQPGTNPIVLVFVAFIEGGALALIGVAYAIALLTAQERRTQWRMFVLLFALAVPAFWFALVAIAAWGR